ncbi:MAG: DUF523 domain-containing protein [Desulfuromonas sp.]|nr:MAG: DUF523 domain-containing protein [Desulfuromonas sp.]
MSRPVLVSACLLGLPTRYDGKSKRHDATLDWLKKQGLTPVPVCPEQLAGLATPRPRTFFSSGDGTAVLNRTGSVVSEHGDDMNERFRLGAHRTLEVARLCGAQEALLKERSPSCGVRTIYRGEDKVPGQGVCAALLQQNGIAILSEEDIPVKT